jgi:hypothetical protein
MLGEGVYTLTLCHDISGTTVCQPHDNSVVMVQQCVTAV